MIVRVGSDHLLLITQPDHAALSACLFEAWKADGLPGHPRRDTLLLAVREHDNGWIEHDAQPGIDASTREPYDFLSTPDALRHEIWPRGIERLARRSAYAAALVAQHALTTFAHHQGEAAWEPFFSDRTRERNTLLGLAAGDAPAALFLADYRVLHLTDLLSLVFCCGWTGPFEREGYRIILRGSRLDVSPDPFDGQHVTIRVPARRVPRRRYRDAAELHGELARARPEILTGQAAGPAVPRR